MAHLIYTDSAPNPPGSALPLPEGWPAADHDESDSAVAKAKIASGSYRKKAKAKDGE